jgi:hypothetical protein
MDCRGEEGVVKREMVMAKIGVQYTQRKRFLLGARWRVGKRTDFYTDLL